MGDYYTEQLVKKRTNMKDTFIKALLVACSIVSVLIVFMFPFGIIVPVIMGVVDFIVFRRLDVEYEYLFVNGDLDIDKIMHKEKRKRVFSTNVNDMDLLAPAGAAELNQYANVKTINFSSGSADARIYEMVISDKGEKKRLVFEPNQTIVEGMWMLAPRKVIKTKK